MNEPSKEQLLAQFSEYLDQTDATQSPPSVAESAEQFSLFAELSALKTETKQQSRQVRDALEGFKDVFQTLQTGHDLLVKEVERRKVQEKQQTELILKPLFEQLLDLYDRLLAGCQASAGQSRGWFARPWFARQRRDLQAVHDGQEMTLTRLRDILASYQIRPMQCVGQIVDPRTMHVVEIEHSPNTADGMVTAQLRSGFVWGDTVLRPAQVKANKL